MKKFGGETELSDHWSLTSKEHDIIATHSGKNRLGIAAQLKFLQIEGRFPRQLSDIPPVANEYLAQQLNISPAKIENYDWDGRTNTLHRQHTRSFLSYRTPTAEDAEAIIDWLKREIFPFDHNSHHLMASAFDWCQRNRGLKPNGTKSCAKRLYIRFPAHLAIATYLV